MVQNRFNLVDEPWIPIANEGLKSLKDVFSGECKTLGGTPREKIALLKLLLAIAQAAFTPKNYLEWKQHGAAGLGAKCLDYLDKNKALFFLYGQKPFLQMPVQKAAIRRYGCFLPQVATGNTSRLTDLQNEFPVSDAQKALILICEMSMCLGGKKVDNKYSLDPGHEKKVSGAAGPGMCSLGLQHSFITGKNLLETLWLNLIDLECINKLTHFSAGLGIPPWEKMPESEICIVAQDLQHSFIGRLVPLARYCLLTEEGIHYTEGIRHPDYQSNFFDPSVSFDKHTSKTRMIWTDPEKRPWRNLVAMLGFLDAERATSKFDCLYLQEGIGRLKNTDISNIGIWCGGFKVSSNAGEQYATGNDDSVESEFSLNIRALETESWYGDFQREMEQLEKFSKIIYSCVNSYMSSQKMDNGLAKVASGIFWERSEEFFPDLLDNCDNKTIMPALRKKFKSIVYQTYDSICPQDTGSKMLEWARYRPFARRYRKNNAELYQRSGKILNSNKENTSMDEKNFVEYVFKRKKDDTGFAAKLRRCDNRDTEYYAYEILSKFIDMQKDSQRLPYALIGAAICKDNSTIDGEDNLGTSLAKCLKAKWDAENKWERMSEKERDDKIRQGSLRMRRLLDCDSIDEICLILRQIITYIQSNMPGSLSYSQLLADINGFDSLNSNSIKRKWATQFFEILLPVRKDADIEENKS